MPFDQFTVEQIAGDLLPNATLDQKIATGFLRNSMFNNEGGVDPAKLVPILNYDGAPITARFITDEISRRLAGARTMDLRKAAQ